MDSVSDVFRKIQQLHIRLIYMCIKITQYNNMLGLSRAKLNSNSASGLLDHADATYYTPLCLRKG